MKNAMKLVLWFVLGYALSQIANPIGVLDAVASVLLPVTEVVLAAMLGLAATIAFEKIRASGRGDS